MNVEIRILIIIITFSLISCNTETENQLTKTKWECVYYDNSNLSRKDNIDFFEKIINEQKFWIFNIDSSGFILNRETNDKLIFQKWNLSNIGDSIFLEIIYKQKDYYVNANPDNPKTFEKKYNISFINDTLVLNRVDKVELYKLTAIQEIIPYVDTVNYEFERKQHERRIKKYVFPKIYSVDDVINDSCRIWSGKKSNIDLWFNKDKLLLCLGFHGQCIYEYPLKKENNKIIIYWDYSPDCVFQCGLEEKFDLTEYPKIGTKFMSLELKNDTTLKANYYYPKWIEKYNEFHKKNGINRFGEYSGDGTYIFTNEFKFNKEYSEFFIK